MTFAPLILGAYLLAGGWIFLYYDSWEMKKPVPYGNLPSIYPLEVWRTIICMVMCFCGVTVFVVYGLKGMYRFIRVFRRARRRFR